jgi:hypothetical protein
MGLWPARETDAPLALHRGWPAVHKTRPAALLTAATVHVAGDCDAKYLTGKSCDDGKKCTEHDKCDNYGICQGKPTVCAPSAYPQCSYTKCDDYTGAPTFPCLILRPTQRCHSAPFIAAAAVLVSLVLHLWSAGYQHQMRMSLSKGQIDVGTGGQTRCPDAGGHLHNVSMHLDTKSRDPAVGPLAVGVGGLLQTDLQLHCNMLQLC